MNESAYKQDNFDVQIENISQKERFGLFTQPPPLCVGDPFGKRPQTSEPRNFYCTPNKTGNHKDALFSQSGYISINDFYRDPYRYKQQYLKQKADCIPHFQKFKPSDNSKSLYGSAYKYMNPYTPKVFNTRDEYGNVRTGPKGFMTNPMKKGKGNSTNGHLFGQYSYMHDPYESKDENNLKETLMHKQKNLLNSKPFCSSSHEKQLFTTSRQLYGPKQKLFKQFEYDPSGLRAIHRRPFRPNNPAKFGYNRTLNKFPSYHQDPEKRKPRAEIFDNPPWIPNYNGTLSRPCSALKSLQFTDKYKINLDSVKKPIFY